jgi:hypothetical protein
VSLSVFRAAQARSGIDHMSDEGLLMKFGKKVEDALFESFVVA